MPSGRKSHPLFARWYARVSPGMDAGGMAGYRKRALAGLAGRVIEVGAGNGLNFAHYPAAVTRVLAVEPDPYLRGAAAQRAAQAPVAVEIADGVAERLPAADGAFDAAVLTLVLCSVADQRAALAEVWRVVRPGPAPGPARAGRHRVAAAGRRVPCRPGHGRRDRRGRLHGDPVRGVPVPGDADPAARLAARVGLGVPGPVTSPAAGAAV